MRWIIGDVHGMLRPLEALVAAVQKRDADAEFFFCGDYCDRGPDTRGAVDLLLSLDRATLVRGNHDDVLDLALHGQNFVTGPALSGGLDKGAVDEIKEAFLNEGLMQTLTSYGADPRELGRRGGGVGDWAGVLAWVDEALAGVPQTHRTFFRELPAVAETDDFFVCHATWPPDQLDAQGRMNGIAAGDATLRHDVLWGRYVANQLRSKKVWRRPGYVGHTPVLSYAAHGDLVRDADGPAVPIHAAKLTLLDTAAFAVGGLLSAYCHDDARTIQADREGDVISLP